MSRRSKFISTIKKQIKEHPDSGTLYLCSADFADFKTINYRYGFDLGDQLLDAVVEFTSHTPQCLCCSRSYGDQFIFVIRTPKAMTEEEIISFYDSYSATFIASQQANFPAFPLKIWCGICSIQGGDVEFAIDNANMVRMEAKRRCSQTAVLYNESMLVDWSRQKAQESEVMSALQEGRFSFFLQPQVDLLTGEIIGAEALARGKSSTGELISPAAFVPIMESNGSVLELDFTILRQVCSNLRERLDRGEPVVRISVNLSRLHLKQSNTAEKLHAIVSQYQIPSELLIFELTENILLSDFAEAKKLRDRLSDFGYLTSIDDFGSGYAGLDVWRNLTFDELKLDRTFLLGNADIMHRNEILISGFVEIAHRLGIEVICEGVETPEQCRLLLDAGCHLAQGFYFSRPIPPQEFYGNYQARGGHYSVDEYRPS